MAASAVPENGFDFLRGTLDEVKTRLLARLSAPPGLAPVAPATDGLSVYLVYLRRDVARVQTLQADLEHRWPALGAAPVPPPLQFAGPTLRGTPAELRLDHEAKLRASDATVVVCAEAPRDWIGAKLTELKRTGPAVGTARAVFFMPPPDLPLERYPVARTVDELLAFLRDLPRR
jgi:hypothetical protein